MTPILRTPAEPAGMARSPPVRLSRGLLLVSAAFGALSVVAALSSAWQASLHAVATLATLAGFVAVEGRALAPRVRWGLAAGIGLLAAVMVARPLWYRERAADWDRLIDGRAGDFRSAMLQQSQQTIQQERMAAFGLLLGLICLAVALLALPGARLPNRGAVTAVIGLLFLALVGQSVLSRVDDASVLDLVAAMWPALLATLVAAGLLVLSGWRARRAWMLPVGALLLAAMAATNVDHLVGEWQWWWKESHPRQEAFLEVGISVSSNDGPQWSAAWEAAVALAGPALLAIGALRSHRDIADTHS